MKKRNWLSAAAVLLVLALALGGCGKKKPTAEELLQNAQTAMQEAASMSGNLSMEMKMNYSQSGISGEMAVAMDMDMQSTKDPEAAHIDGGMSVMGMKFDMETYTVKEDGRYMTYTNVFDTWTKAEAEMDKTALDSMVSFESLADQGVELTLKEETEQFEGQEAYVITTVLDGEVLARMMENSAALLGETTGQDTIDYSKMTADTTIRIYKENGCLAQISMDLSGMEDAAGFGDLGLEEASITTFYVTVSYYSYNDVEEIRVPAEAKENAVSADDFLTDAGDDLTFPDPEDPDWIDLGDFETGEIVQDDQGRYVLEGYYEEDDVQALVPTPEGFTLDTLNSDPGCLIFDMTVDENSQEEFYVIYTAYLLEDGFGEEIFSQDHQNDVRQMMGDSSYSEVAVTDVQTVMVGDYEVRYTKLTYTYGGTIRCQEFNTWVITDGNRILSCDTCESAYGGECSLVPDEKALMEILYGGVGF